MSLERALNSIGKRCFVNCFEAAMRNRGILPPEQIVRHDPKVGRDMGGLNTRAHCIQKIFSAGQQYAALRICKTARIDAEMKEKTQDLLRKYCV